MDTITKSGAALCFGDSGGPAFYYPNPQQKNRFVISTNSRGDISTTSYLSASSTEIAVRFIKNWAQSNGQNGQICGAFPDAQGCRGGGGGGGGGGGQTNFVSEGRFVRMEGLIKGGNFPEGWVKNVIDQAVSYIDFEGQ
jgi:hypothetical protein